MLCQVCLLNFDFMNTYFFIAISRLRYERSLIHDVLYHKIFQVPGAGGTRHSRPLALRGGLTLMATCVKVGYIPPPIMYAL